MRPQGYEATVKAVPPRGLLRRFVRMFVRDAMKPGFAGGVVDVRYDGAMRFDVYRLFKRMSGVRDRSQRKHTTSFSLSVAFLTFLSENHTTSPVLGGALVNDLLMKERRVRKREEKLIILCGLCGRDSCGVVGESDGMEERRRGA
jgi:hypothetical protein